MPLYRYEALDRTGNVVVGAMQVTDESALSTRLSAMGYQPTRVELAQRNLTPAAGGLTPTGSPVVTTRPDASNLTASERAVAQLFHQLHIALRSGMPAIQSITTVSAQVHDRGLREALIEMGMGVQSGRTISEMMERHPCIFSRGDVGTVRAAEMGGFLPEAMALLGTQHEQEDNTQRRLRVWVWFLHSNIFGLFLFIPAAIFLKDAIPALDVKAGLHSALNTFLFVSLPLTAAFIAFLVSFQKLRKSPTFAPRWHRFLLKVPVVSGINRLRANAVFTRTLQYLSRAGLPLASAWETASGAVPNLHLASIFATGIPVVEQTGRLSLAMQQTGLLDPNDVGMMSTGESAGEVPQALDYLASRYESEAQAALGASVVRGAITLTAWTFILGGIAMAILAWCYGQGLFGLMNSMEN